MYAVTRIIRVGSLRREGIVSSGGERAGREPDRVLVLDDDPNMLARVQEVGFGYVHKTGGTEPYERLAGRVERLVVTAAARPDAA